MNKTENIKTKRRHSATVILGIVLCVFLASILMINLTLIFKSITNKNDVPTFAGIFPMVVLTDSMEGVIDSGDLIVCSTIAPEKVKQDDIISFFDPESNRQSIVIHRVKEIQEIDGKLCFITKGDTNNSNDPIPIPAENLVGIYKLKIRNAGHVTMFLQSTPGIILCVVLPLVIFLITDLISHKKEQKKKQQDTNALLAELENLKKQQAANNERATSETTDIVGAYASGDNV